MCPGDNQVGKTTVVQQYCEYQMSSKVHTHPDFGVKKMIIDNQIVRVQIWDSIVNSDEEKTNSFSYRFYRSVNAIVFVYDIGNEATFGCIKEWHPIITKFCHKGLPILFLGNKLDLSKRKKSCTDIKHLVDNVDNVTVAEVSALHIVNLSNAFTNFIEKLVRDGPVPQTFKALGNGGNEPEDTNTFSFRKLICGCCTE